MIVSILGLVYSCSLISAFSGQSFTTIRPYASTLGSHSDLQNDAKDPRKRGAQTTFQRLSNISGGAMSYNEALANRPVKTKAVTSGVITGLGDFAAQKIVGEKFQYARFVAFSLTGGLFVGPSVAYWYRWLVSIAVSLHMPCTLPSHLPFSLMTSQFGSFQQRLESSDYRVLRKLKTLILVAVDQTLGVLWFFPLFFLSFELAEAFCYLRPFSMMTVRRRIVEDLGEILLMQYKVWPLVNTFSFSIVPVQYRVLWSNVVSVFWNIYLCKMVGA